MAELIAGVTALLSREHHTHPHADPGANGDAQVPDPLRWADRLRDDDSNDRADGSA
jgi:hypothetical protein